MAPTPPFYSQRRVISTMLPLLSELLMCIDLAENNIKMEELISMFSYLLENESNPGTNASSTLGVLIRTSRQYRERLRRLSTMPERMVTSFMNTEKDLENLELFQADAIAYGQMLYLLSIKKTFLQHCATGLQEITSSILMRSSDSQTDITLPHRPITIRRAIPRYYPMQYMTGYSSPESETEVETDE